VSFLSREYSDEVWYGSTDSMCDVPRQLSKLHVTPHLPPNCTPFQKLHEKMSGFYVSDLATPIIGDIAKAVVEAHGLSTSNFGLMNYFSTYPTHEQFPNENVGDWMTARVLSHLPDFDFRVFKDWLKACESDANLLLTPPLCVPTKSTRTIVKRPVVVNGDIVLPPDVKPLVVSEKISALYTHYPAKGALESMVTSVTQELAVDSVDVIPEFIEVGSIVCPAGKITDIGSDCSSPTVTSGGSIRTAVSKGSIKSKTIVCRHVADGNCPFPPDRCNHLVKKQKCYGSRCKWVHGGKPDSSLPSVKSDNPTGVGRA
jgi:hypothetical protein